VLGILRDFLEDPMTGSKHVWRLGLLLVAAFIGIFLLRSWLVPESWGDQGNYRFANVAEQMNVHPPRHGGIESCKQCHEDDEEYRNHEAGKHQVVPCEDCHAPVATHVKDGEQEWDMQVIKTGDWCLRCHLKLKARPQTQPQIEPVQHLREQAVESVTEDWDDQICYECHDPHNPKVAQDADENTEKGNE